MGAHLQYRIVKPTLLSVFFVTEGFGGVVVVECGGVGMPATSKTKFISNLSM